jgi:hypothetical protein
VVFETDGLRIEVPASWEARVLRRSPHLRALQAASFALEPDDDELGSQSTATMESGDCFVGLVEYLPGSGIAAGQAPFNPRRIDLPLDPTRFSPRALAHPQPAQSGWQQCFTEAGRPFGLYLVIAGSRPDRRYQLPLLDAILGSLRVSPPPASDAP